MAFAREKQLESAVRYTLYALNKLSALSYQLQNTFQTTTGRRTCHCEPDVAMLQPDGAKQGGVRKSEGG